MTAPRFVCAIPNTAAPIVSRLRFLRSALAVASVDAHRGALALDDRPTPADARACDELRVAAGAGACPEAKGRAS